MEWRHYMDCFQERAATAGDRTALRYKRDGEWREMSRRELAERVRTTALGLLALGVREDEPVGILSPDRPEWTIVDLAAQAIRAVPVPIDATCPAERAAFIVEDAPLRFLFAGPGASWEMGRALLDRCEGLERLIPLETESTDGEPPEAGDDRILGMDAIGERGEREGDPAELSARAGRYAGSDRLAILYASDAAGQPGGVVLRHDNIRFQIEALERHLPPMDESDLLLCLPPPNHGFHRLWTLHALSRGAAVCHGEDPEDFEATLATLAEARPTILCAGPDFFETLHRRIMDRRAASSRLGRALFDAAMKAGLLHHLCQKDRLRSQEPLLLQLKFRILDRLAFRKIRGLVGGRIRFMPCAGATLSPEIDEFFFAAGLPPLCGYGLAETFAIAACRTGGKFRFGNAGLPLPGMEIRIAPRTKEIQVRGGNVMAGYHNRPDATAEAFTEDGFLRTGDTGKIQENGELRITGRIRNE